MTRQRCRHGFAREVGCYQCDSDEARRIAQARRLETRQKALEAAIGRARFTAFCVLCGVRGHISKLCPSTEVGKRRLAERGAA